MDDELVELDDYENSDIITTAANSLYEYIEFLRITDKKVKEYCEIEGKIEILQLGGNFVNAKPQSLKKTRNPKNYKKDIEN